MIDATTPAAARRRTHKTIAGWLAFLAAVALSLASALGRLLGKAGDHTEVIGLATAFLAYSAACFGLRTYQSVAETRAAAAPKE